MFILQVKELITGIINQMIDEAKTKLTDCRSQPKQPLIRLRVLYQNEDYAINEIRFGQQFNQQVSAQTMHWTLHKLCFIDIAIEK